MPIILAILAADVKTVYKTKTLLVPKHLLS